MHFVFVLNLKEISSIKKEKVLVLRNVFGSLYLGAPKQRADQCQLISKEIDPAQHGIHLVLC